MVINFGRRMSMRFFVSFILGISMIFTDGSPALAKIPLYPGTVWISSDVLTPDSPTDFVSVTYQGLSNKRTFDRRVNAWVNQDSHVFEARFECGRQSVLVVVNSEFSRDKGEVQAKRFALILGQLPFGSRQGILEIWVHSGYEPAGGGNSSILIHTDFADRHQSFLEEVFIHEAAHTSLDWDWSGVVNREKWKAAANADGGYVSQYGSDHPDREDVAESYGAFVLHEMAKTTPILRSQAERIGLAIPNRLDYFRSLGPEFGPSRSVCKKYGVSQNTAQQKRIVTGTWLQANTVRQSSLPSLNENGVDFRAKLLTKLERGYSIRITLGKGKQAKVITQRVGKAGHIKIRANVRSVSRVSVKDSKGKVLARWNLSELP
jgi:hypothetical protein